MESADLYTGSASRLAELFHDSLDALGTFESVQASDLPDDARALLAHNNHMTVTLESFHNSPVDVEILAERADDGSYAREVLLRHQSDRSIVQFGIMRIWLADLTAIAERDIRQQKLPLGRVLIDHGVLREVELMNLWRIHPSEHVDKHLGGGDIGEVFGRTAQILVDQRPTVQLLEIVGV
jgi:chorismate-pyruvate lyase